MPVESNAAISEVGRNAQAPRTLRLRMIGTSRNGQIIELSSPRVTIGSAPNCVLQLRSANVRPLQCLIVREPSGVIVRSLAVDTLLNGQKFRDEILCRGDRLQVGPIALEVIDDGFTPNDVGTTDASQPMSTDESDSGEPTNDDARPVAVIPNQTPASLPDGLLDRIKELEQRIQGLMTETNEPEVQPETVVEPVAAAEQVPANEPPRKSDELPDAFFEQLAEWKRLTAQLEQERESAKVDLARVQRDTNHLRDRCHQLDRSRTEADERMQKLQLNVDNQMCVANVTSTRLKAEVELRHAFVLIETQQLRCELDALKVRCNEGEQARSELERSLTQSQDRCRELELRLQECTSRLSEAEARWSEVRSPEVRSEVPPASLEEVPQESSLSSATSPPPSNRLQELMRLSQSFTESNEAAPSVESPTDTKWDDDSTRRIHENDSANDPSEEIDTAKEDEALLSDFFSRMRRGTAEKPPSPPSPREESQDSQPLFSVRFLANADDLPQCVEDPSSSNPSQPDPAAHYQPEPPATSSNGQHYTEDPAAHYQPEPPARSITAQPENVEQSSVVRVEQKSNRGNCSTLPAGEPERLQDRGTDLRSRESSTRRADGEDVFERLSRAGIWKGIEAEASKTVEACPTPEASGSPPTPVAMLAGQDRHKAGDAGEEDSIESYMERLLERVRGDGSAETGQRRNEVVQLSETEPSVTEQPPLEKLPTSTSPPPEPAVLTESEYQPRSQAPEMNVNLAAMRAIANDSRKNNMRVHAQQKWSNKSQSKFVGALIGLGIAGTSFYFLDTHTEFAAIGFFTGCSIAAFWLWRAFRYRRQLFDSLQLETKPAAAEPPKPAPVEESASPVQE